MAAARVLFEPWRLLTSPLFYGVDRSDRSSVSAGRHQHAHGRARCPAHATGLYERTGVIVRSLGDHVHFSARWRDPAHPLRARSMAPRELRSPECVPASPSSSFRAVPVRCSNHKGEQYHLIWKRRTGFASLASKHGYPIVPFAPLAPRSVTTSSSTVTNCGQPARPRPGVAHPRPDEHASCRCGHRAVGRATAVLLRFECADRDARWAGRGGDQAACLELRAEVARAIEPRQPAPATARGAATGRRPWPCVSRASFGATLRARAPARSNPNAAMIIPDACSPRMVSASLALSGRRPRRCVSGGLSRLSPDRKTLTEEP